MANTGNGVYIWDEDHNDWENIGTAIGSKGEKGDPSTVPGPAGQDGVTPVISANASVDANTGTPSVTVTKSGTDANPTFAFNFHNLKGNDGVGIPGMKGDSGEQGLPGENGENGRDGQDGITPQISATASITENGGSPAVQVVKTGTDEAPTFAFNFQNLKGSAGISGTDGQSIVGPAGPAGVTPNVTINASVDNSSGTPSVVVTKTGSNENPTFSLDFSGLRGRDGNPGADGQSIVGPAGQPGRDGYAISWKVRAYEIDATLGRFWLTSIYFWDDPTLSHNVGQFIYGSTNTSSYFGRIDGFGTYNGTPNVPYVLFENLTQVVSAQGEPGKSIRPTSIVFDNTMVTPATISYANNIYGSISPLDSILDSTNTYIATVVSTDPQAQTAVIDNIKRIGGPGTVGPTPNIRVNASVSDTVGTPNVQVTNGGTPENPIINLAFSGLKGQNGISPALPNISATATVDNTVGTPSVVVTKSGTNANPNFNFSFNRLKGESGTDGKNYGYWYYIYDLGSGTTVSESALNRGSTSGYNNVEVGDVIYTKDGFIAMVQSISNHVCTLTSKTLLKGEKGEKGQKGDTGNTGPQGPPLDSNVYYTKAEVDALLSRFTGGGRVLWRGGTSLYIQFKSINNSTNAFGLSKKYTGTMPGGSAQISVDNIDLPAITKPSGITKGTLYIAGFKVRASENIVNDSYNNANHYTYYHNGILLPSGYTNDLYDLDDGKCTLLLTLYPYTDFHVPAFAKLIDSSKNGSALIDLVYVIIGS